MEEKDKKETKKKMLFLAAVAVTGYLIGRNSGIKIGRSRTENEIRNNLLNNWCSVKINGKVTPMIFKKDRRKEVDEAFEHINDQLDELAMLRKIVEAIDVNKEVA